MPENFPEILAKLQTGILAGIHPRVFPESSGIFPSFFFRSSPLILPKFYPGFLQEFLPDVCL